MKLVKQNRQLRELDTSWFILQMHVAFMNDYNFFRSFNKGAGRLSLSKVRNREEAIVRIKEIIEQATDVLNKLENLK